MRKGEKIETLTKTLGQTPRTGVVVDIRDEEFVEIEWEDGHTSMISRSAITPASEPKQTEGES